MKALQYIREHPVFTRKEFVEAYLKDGKRSKYTADNLLKKHVASGRLLRVRPGLYAAVPEGIDPKKADVDPYLLVTQLADDAVVAYHAALQFHGRAYSVWYDYPYLTRTPKHPFAFRGHRFRSVSLPASLRDSEDAGGGIMEERHAGGLVRVTSLERTMVDVLASPKYGGGWEEVWRSLESVEFFDLDAVIDYALRLGSALTIARVGFYLEQHRDALLVEEPYLDALRKHVPSQNRYFDQKREPGKLVSGWNLIVPDRVLHRTWEENQ